jgi:hypothetical protein
MRSCDPSIKRSRFIRGLPPTPRVGPMRWPASENAFRLACCSTDIHFCQMEAESTCPERHSIDTVGTRVTCRRIEIYTSKSSSSRLVRTSPCPLLVVMTLPCPLRFKRRRRRLTARTHSGPITFGGADAKALAISSDEDNDADERGLTQNNSAE